MQTTQDVSLRDLLRIVFKRKTQVSLFLIICVGIGITLSLLSPIYEAQAKILVKVGRENVFSSSNDTLSPVFTPKLEQLKQQINSEIEILGSRFLATKVTEFLKPAVIYKDLERLAGGPQVGSQGLVRATVFRIQEDMRIENVPNSDIIAISFNHTDPHIAAKVINTLVDLYLDYHLKLYQSSQALEFYRKQSELLQNKVKKGEQLLSNFMIQHGLTSPAEEKVALLKQQADLGAGLNQASSQQAETESRLRELNRQLAETSQTILLNEEKERSLPVVLQEKLVELEAKERELDWRYHDQVPFSRELRKIRDQIQVHRTTLAKPETNTKSRSGINPLYHSLVGEIFREEAALKAFKAKKETQLAQLADYREKIDKLNKAHIELNNLQRQVEPDAKNYQLYLNKFEEFRISNAMDVEKISNVSIIDPAFISLNPVSPKPMLNIMLSIFVGVIGGLGLASFLEYFNRTLETVQDVGAYLDLPVIASIPEIKETGDVKLLTYRVEQ